MCLNYERTRAEPGKPWWKKNLNLKFSRKLTVFSTVLLIIACQIDSLETLSSFTPLTPLERLAFALDHIGDTSFLSAFIAFLDNYEDFLAAKSHSELETLDNDTAEDYSAKAEQFDTLLHDVLRSSRLDPRLLRYLVI